VFRAARRITVLTALAITASAQAHHSPVMFDPSKPMTLTGTVRLFQWTNPHCYIQLIVEDGGQRTEWSMEMGAPLYLYNHGWRPGSLKAGDQIRITAAPLRNGGNGGLVLDAVRVDGTQLGRVK